MMQRMKGTLRPGRKAGVLALAVLLLTCVLMAGAVSASDKANEFNQSSFDAGGGTFEINSAGTYTLNATACGTIEINALDQDVTITALENVILYGRINVTSAKTVTVHQMTFHLNKSMVHSNKYLRAVEYPLYGSIKFNLTGNTLVVDPDVVENVTSGSDTKISAQLFASNGGVSDGTIFSENTVYNATGHAITFHGIAENGKATVERNTVSLYPDEDINGDNGRALVKVWLYQNYENVNLTIRDNTLTNNRPDYNVSMFRVDGTTSHESGGFTELTVEMNGDNKVNGVSASPYLYAGSVSSEKLKGFLVKDAENNIQLIPGLNQTGVVWGGDSTSGYTLSITEPGSYKLMGDFTTTGSGIQITADGVTLDGSEGKITTADTLNGYILKVAVDVDDTENAKGVTLQNLDITGTKPSGTGNYGGVTVFAGTGKTSVPVILKDSTVDMSQVTTKSGMNPAVYFVNAPNSQITNNEITAGNTEAKGSSTPRAIVVADGSGISISNNEITMGAAQEGVVSHAIQFQGPPTGVTISGNKITATSENSLNRAVSLTTTGAEGESYVITGNTLTGKMFNAAVHVIIPSSIKEGASFKLEIDGNTFTNTDNGVMIADYGTNGITLTGKINTDDFPGKTAETIIFAEEGVVTLSDTFEWTHDPEPSYSSSSGNMDNAYRVLFNDGATTLSVQTDLSSGDKLTKPETPVKDGYTFAGWYKDSACTQGWDFETGISGDMTLYAKWTAAGSSGETEETTAPTATSTAVTTPQPTKTQTAAATTSAPQATTAAGVSPTLTQAPAPVAGALFGLLAAGVLLRRRFQ